MGVALAMCPLIAGQDDFVDALLGPEASQSGAQTVTYLRLPLAGDSGGRRFTFRAPDARQVGKAGLPASAAVSVQQWVIALNPHPLAPVVAKVGNRLPRLDAAIATEWTRLDKDASRVSHLGMFHWAPPKGLQPGSLWLDWIENDYGLVVHAL